MKFMLIAFIMAAFLAGCGNNEVGRGDESQLALIKATNPEPLKLSPEKEKSIADKVKEDIRKIDEL
ncbi:MAG TPA: hypothetical protein VEY51_15680, partial [Chondromyces sp.]|nr:hypothetical protein [Chondromyces sp.]